jgi:hypothetical protein
MSTRTLKLADGLALPANGMTEANLNWAAGLFEGEGTVTIAVRNSDETYRVVCTLGSTDEQLIDLFQAWWPGYKQPAYGERPGRKPAWYWTVIAHKATVFMRTIRPYLRTERVQRKIDLALDFQSFRTRGPACRTDAYKERQRAIYQSMKALNKRGVAA